MRADQILANYGYCSRREAARWIKNGWLTDKDGWEIENGAEKHEPTDVLVRGEPIPFPKGLLVMFHKPIGYTCSHNPAESPLIYDLLPSQWLSRNPAVTTVGRLDKESSGLLLITDQGQLVQQWTSPKHHLPKTYEVTTTADIPEESIALFASGTLVLRQETHPCLPAQLTLHSSRRATISMDEGRYHQVRRMFASQGCPVETLHRSAFGSLTLGDLLPNTWREVTKEEIAGGGG